MARHAPTASREFSKDSCPGQVCAVVVTYYPNIHELTVLLGMLCSQVGWILVIDNATADEVFESFANDGLPGNAAIIRNAVNEGLGAAFNKAACWAKQNNYRYLLLLDQDSLVRSDLVSRLLAAYSELSKITLTAAVGPMFVDRDTGRPAPFVRIGFPFNEKLFCMGNGFVPCDFLISSGTLIPIAVLNDVGDMDESLFIDNVDIEWCFRARHKGYSLYGVGGAQIEHRIGDRVVSLPWLLGDVTVHSPVRLYYMMRNRLLLYRREATPRLWIAQDIPRAVLKFLRLALFIPPRWRNASYMLKGIRDGWRQKSGPAELDAWPRR